MRLAAESKSQERTNRVRSTSLAPPNTWDYFAKEDAYTYIMTSVREGDYGTFWRSGEETVANELIPLFQKYKLEYGMALEIGCGIGRLAIPLSLRMERVVGVDISNGMVRQGREAALGRGLSNVSFEAIAKPEQLPVLLGDSLGKIDFIYSLLVFQHIDRFRIIRAYIDAVGTLLSPTGLAYLQFDTRPKTFAYKVKTAMPDRLLPRFWKRGIRRLRQDHREVEAALFSAGLDVVDNIAPETDYHRYVLRKRHAPGVHQSSVVEGAA